MKKCMAHGDNGLIPSRPFCSYAVRDIEHLLIALDCNERRATCKTNTNKNVNRITIQRLRHLLGRLPPLQVGCTALHLRRLPSIGYPVE